MNDLWTIYSIGDGSFLYQVLAAVAMITATGDFVDLAKIGMLFGIFILAFQGIMQGGRGINVGAVLVSMVMFSATYGTKTTVTIVDVYSSQVRVLSGVPYGIAVAGSVVSRIGYSLTEKFEMAFSLPSMSDKGFLRALEVVKRIRINSIDRIGLGQANSSGTDYADFETSWINYIRECTIQGVYMGAATAGGKGRMSDAQIVNGKNLIEQLKYVNQVNATKLEIDQQKIMSCDTAHTALATYTMKNFYEEYIKGTIATALEKSNGPAAEAEISGALQDLGFLDVSAQDFVITSVLEPIYAKAWQAEHASLPSTSSFAVAINDALRQRAAQWYAEGALWQRSVRPFLTFLEGFIFAVTPFIAIMIAMGSVGFKLVGKYLQLLFWIQLWMPVLSIANMYTMLSLKQKLDAITKTEGGGSSLTSITGIITADGYIQEYLATGQMLAASTPVLALLLTTGAAVTATQLASRLGGGDFVDEKKVAPDRQSSAPMIATSPVYTHDQIGGSRMTGADQVLPVFGFSSTGGRELVSQTQRMEQAQTSFGNQWSRTVNEATTRGWTHDTGQVFTQSNSSNFSKGEAAAWQVSRGAVEQHSGQIGQNADKVQAYLSSEALSMGGKMGAGAGGFSLGGEYTKSLSQNLQRNFGMTSGVADSLASSFAKQMNHNSTTQHSIGKAVAHDVREGISNQVTSTSGVAYSDQLTRAAQEVHSTSTSYGEASRLAGSAEARQSIGAAAFGERVVKNSDLQKSLNMEVDRHNLGGAVQNYMKSEHGAWLTEQLGGNHKKAHAVASMMALQGLLPGAPRLAPGQANEALAASYGFAYRALGADYGSMGNAHQNNGVGSLSPTSGSIVGPVQSGTAPAQNLQPGASPTPPAALPPSPGMPASQLSDSGGAAPQGGSVGAPPLTTPKVRPDAPERHGQAPTQQQQIGGYPSQPSTVGTGARPSANYQPLPAFQERVERGMQEHRDLRARDQLEFENRGLAEQRDASQRITQQYVDFANGASDGAPELPLSGAGSSALPGRYQSNITDTEGLNMTQAQREYFALQRLHHTTPVSDHSTLLPGIPDDGRTAHAEAARATEIERARAKVISEAPDQARGVAMVESLDRAAESGQYSDLRRSAYQNEVNRSHKISERYGEQIRENERKIGEINGRVSE